MATKKVARSEKHSSTQPAAAAASESRIKAALVPPFQHPSARERRQLALTDARDLIGEIRKDIAQLWWYADRSLAGESGCEPDVARAAMADLACSLGLDLNHLDRSLGDMVKECSEQEAK